MESINTILEKRNIHLPLRYYGADDLSVGLEIRSIVENRDLFESLYSTYPLDCVSDINSYYYYLLTRKIFRMEEKTRKYKGVLLSPRARSMLEIML